MQGPLIFLFAMTGLMLAIFLVPTPSRTKKLARGQLCQQLAKQVQSGEAKLSEYLVTDCSAKNLTERGEKN